MPFSDPLADGTTLQHASEVALRNGASLPWALELAARLRARTDVPLVAMTCFNPVHHYGVERFVEDSVAAGLDGVIVPDLPWAEAAPLAAASEARSFHLIQLVAPTSTPERLAEVARTAKGFVYCVSLLGTTGARAQLPERLPELLQRVRAHVRQPLLVGFGISRPEHIAGIRPHADAVVVASAMADLLGATPAGEWESAVSSYVARLRAACEPVSVSS